jgi:hypothetical protein
MFSGSTARLRAVDPVHAYINHCETPDGPPSSTLSTRLASRCPAGETGFRQIAAEGNQPHGQGPAERGEHPLLRGLWRRGSSGARTGSPRVPSTLGAFAPVALRWGPEEACEGYDRRFTRDEQPGRGGGLPTRLSPAVSGRTRVSGGTLGSQNDRPQGTSPPSPAPRHDRTHRDGDLTGLTPRDG